jgi:hypothetical protein
VPRPLGPPEEERGTTGLDRAVDDLGHLEEGVDLGVHLDELVLPPEQVDPLAKVGGDHLRRV